jgi:hypothetical protein
MDSTTNSKKSPIESFSLKRQLEILEHFELFNKKITNKGSNLRIELLKCDMNELNFSRSKNFKHAVFEILPFGGRADFETKLRLC